MDKGPLIIVSGPSGSGKSTLIGRLIAEQQRRVRLSVSATTRAPRPKEVAGQHYHFWTRERFLHEVANGAFLEWAEVHGNYYGTPTDEVAPYRDRGQAVILDIDVQGWQQVRAKCPDVVSVFIRTSNEEILRRRLESRGTETPEALERRLQGAKRELAYAAEYDYQVCNDGAIDQALAELRTILESAFQRRTHAG